METENQQSESLIDLASILSHQNDYQEILRLVGDNAVKLLKAEIAIIMMINPRTRQTVRTIFKVGDAGQQQYSKAHKLLSGWVIKNNRSLLSADIRTDPRFTPNLFENPSIKSVAAVPLTAEAIIIGTLMVFWKGGSTVPDENSLSYLEKLATISGSFLRNVQKIQDYFELTLPNSALLKKYEALGLLGQGERFIELLKGMYEEGLIREALVENGWNQSRTARLLSVSEQTLRYKMAKLGIVRGSEGKL